MQYEKYSVLTSVYIKEKPDYLRRSLESMLHQTVLTNDYVIVKDGPLTPELESVLNEFSQRYPFIHIYGYPKNLGLGAALNFGLKKCQNELVARMDSDDISLPKRCEKELEAFHKNPKLDIIGTAIYEFCQLEDQVTGLKKMPVTKEEIKVYARRRNPFNHPTVMYKKKSVLKNGGYPQGQRGEDIELFTRMVFSGCETANIEEPLLKYRVGSGQYQRRTSPADARAVLRVIKDNYKSGYIDLKDFLYVAIAQTAGLMIPKKIGRYLYKKLYRSPVLGKRIPCDLFLVNTPYHLLLSCNEWKEGDVLVCMGDFKWNPILLRMIQETFSSCAFHTNNFYYYRQSIKNLSAFRMQMRGLSEKLKIFCFRNIYTFNDVDPVVQWILKNTAHTGDVILIEEGIGLYRDTKKRHEFLFRLFGKIVFGKSYENVKRIGQSSCVTKIVCSRSENLSVLQKKKQLEFLKPVNYQELAKRLEISQLAGGDWFIGQPLVEDGVLTKEKYLEVVKELIDFSQKIGRRLIIKPHPREELAKYVGLDANLLSSAEIPVELLVDTDVETWIFTLYSSAVLTLSRLKSVKAFVLYKMYKLHENIPDGLFDQNGIQEIHNLDEILRKV